MDGGFMLSRSLALLMLLACSFAFVPSARAVDENPSEDEYDFSWLDPDKKIYVVQNRKYTKKGKLELALSGGIGVGEPYRTRRTVLPRIFYYINESFGVSAFMGFNSNSENSNVEALRAVAGRIPAVRDVQQMVGGSVVWLPFYGKINMFNQILYLDWHLEAGVGQVSSEIDLNTTFGNPANINESSHTSFHWGTGQKFFITRNFAARLDLLAIYYKAPSGVDGSLTSALGSVEDSYDNYFVTLGVSYTF
jgi:outer membrane beta-barrel protein